MDLSSTHITIQTREELISYVSCHLIDVRKETALSQAQMASILGISKNSIINAEKAIQCLSWSVVMATVMLFQQTQAIRRITAVERPLALISRCAFLHNEGTKKNSFLHSSLVNSDANLSLMEALDTLVKLEKKE